MSTNNSLQNILRPTFYFAGIIVFIQVIQLFFDLPFQFFGVFPREFSGLKGIFLSPFYHSGWGHLLSNLMPMVILSGVLFYFFDRVAWQVIFLIYFFTGLMVWLFARQTFHVGASGVIYGFLAFIIWTGVFQRSNVRALVIALAATVLYSGMFAGIAPGEEGISWESHLFGALVGSVVAYIYRHKQIIDDAPGIQYEDLDDEGERFFLDQSTFDDKDDSEVYYD